MKRLAPFSGFSAIDTSCLVRGEGEFGVCALSFGIRDSNGDWYVCHGIADGWVVVAVVVIVAAATTMVAVALDGPWEVQFLTCALL